MNCTSPPTPAKSCFSDASRPLVGVAVVVEGVVGEVVADQRGQHGALRELAADSQRRFAVGEAIGLRGTAGSGIGRGIASALANAIGVGKVLTKSGLILLQFCRLNGNDTFWLYSE